MAFWDSVKNVAKSAGAYAQSQVNEIQEYKEKYGSLSDEQIFKKYMNSSGTRKMACYQLLKERGFKIDN